MTRLPIDEGLDLKAALAAGRAADKLRDALDSLDAPSELVRLSIPGATAWVPAAALQALVDVLEDLSEGREVTVAPADLPVGTVEAARVLGVSRPWVAELIDRGALAGTRVGSKRRVRLGSLIEHRRRLAAAHRQAAAGLGDQGEPVGQLERREG